MSFGIPGLRIGSGAQGNYIHAGRGGLYYRKTLPGSPIPSARIFRSEASADVADRLPAAAEPELKTTTREYESPSAFKMVDATAEDLLKELNAKAGKKRLSTAAWLVAAVVVAMLQLLNVGSVVIFIAILAGLLIGFWTHERDQVARHAVSLYDMDQSTEERYQEFFSVFERLLNVKVWHIESDTWSQDGSSGDRASTRVNRSRTWPMIGTGPKNLKTNIPVPQLRVGRQILHFLPERVLIEAREGYGAVNYSNLTISVSEDSVGSDDRPDTMRYERVHFKSASGLNEVIQISPPGLGEQLRRTLTGLT